MIDGTPENKHSHRVSWANIYAIVIVVMVLVILSIWLFSRYYQ